MPTILNADSGAISGISGLTTSADNSGVLQFQSSGTATLEISTAGNINIPGTGKRITGDFSNATHANRVAFQTSTTDGATSPFILPNGTGTTASIVVANASDPTNSGYGQLRVTSSSADILSGILGTGSYLPLTMYTGGSERLRIDTSGQLGIGTSSPGYRLDVAAGDTTAGLGYAARLRSNSTAGAATLQFTNNAVTNQNAYITADDSQNLTLASGTGYARLWTNGSERMRIDASGNVGIGTSSPGSALHVQRPNGTATYLQLFQTSLESWQIGMPSGVASLTFANSGTEQMRLTTTGFLGIGTSSPTAKLQVGNGTGTPQSYISGSGYDLLLGASGGTIFGYSSGTISTVFNTASVPLGIGTNASQPLIFGTAATERMRILANGVVQTIGTAIIQANVNSPSALSVGLLVRYTGGGSQYGMQFIPSNDNTTPISFANAAGSYVGQIGTTPTVTSYQTASDYRLKENVAPMQNALATVTQLKPVTYNWKVDGSNGQGFIAHELQAVVPDCVTGEKDALDKDGNPKYQGVDTSFLVATLTAAIQEQQAIITDLKARIETLESK
jgi:hypothetical protein